MTALIRAILSFLGLLARVKAHTRAAGAVRVISYWRRV
jgi:hypothetical protein